MHLFCGAACRLPVAVLCCAVVWCGAPVHAGAASSPSHCALYPSAATAAPLPLSCCAAAACCMPMRERSLPPDQPLLAFVALPVSDSVHAHAQLTVCSKLSLPFSLQGAYLGPDQTMLVTEYMEVSTFFTFLIESLLSFYKYSGTGHQVHRGEQFGWFQSCCCIAQSTKHSNNKMCGCKPPHADLTRQLHPLPASTNRAETCTTFAKWPTYRQLTAHLHASLPACLHKQGGDLLHNIAAGRVSWYKRGKKVR